MSDATKKPKWFSNERAVVVSLVVVLFGSVALDSRGQGGAGFLRPGSALTTVGGTRGQRFLVPGQSFINMDASLENLTDDVVTIRSITPVWKYGRRVAKVSRIRVGPLNPKVSGGNFYRSEPPSEVRAGACQQQQLFAVTAYRIQPGEEAVMAVTVNIRSRGRFHIDGWLVTYETQGDLFRQTNRTGVAGRSGDRLVKELGEGECLGTPLWPGAGPSAL